MSTAEKVPVTVARIGGWADEWFAVISAPVMVRYVESAPLPWRCEACGRHKHPTCPHELTAEAAATKKWPTTRKEPTE